jgi:hypothetical protein
MPACGGLTRVPLDLGKTCERGMIW